MEHLINLNFAPGGLPATVHVSQYDDTIRQLRFQLWFGRSKVEVPSGASVRVDIKKPDGHIVLVNGTVNSSDRSIVTVPTTKQMTAVPGGSRGTLVVSSTGDKRISSAIFILQVHRDPVEDGDASDSDLSMLQDAIDQTAANATAAQAAATAAQQAASSFTTDTTLTVTGAAADAKKTGDEISAIKADLGAQGDLVNGEKTEETPTAVSGINFVANATKYSSASSYTTLYIPVSQFDDYAVTVDNSANGNAFEARFAFSSEIPANNIDATYIDKVNVNARKSGTFEYHADTSGYLGIAYWTSNTVTFTVESLTGGIKQRVSAVETVNSRVDDVEAEITGTPSDITFTEVTGINFVADATKYTSSGYYTAWYLPVVAGGKYIIDFVKRNSNDIECRFAYSTEIPAENVSGSYVGAVTVKANKSARYEYNASKDGYLGFARYYPNHTVDISGTAYIDGLDGRINAIESDIEETKALSTAVNGLITKLDGKTITFESGTYWKSYHAIGTDTESQMQTSTSSTAIRTTLTLPAGKTLRLVGIGLTGSTRLYYVFDATTEKLIDVSDAEEQLKLQAHYLRYDVETHIYINHANKNVDYFCQIVDDISQWVDLSRSLGVSQDNVLNLNDNVRYAVRSLRRAQRGGTTPVTFLHFSDIHGDTLELQRIMDFAQDGNISPYINDIICTGDIPYLSLDDTGVDFLDDVSGAENVLLLVGNHDTAEGVGAAGTTYGTATPERVYNELFKDRIANWNVTQPANADTEYLGYYYKDYATQNLRLICLDLNHDSAYLSAELTWFESVLLSAYNAGYSVICANHYMFSKDVCSVVDCSFSPRKEMSNEGSWTIPPAFITAVETFIGYGGEFVCWFGGHVHQDHVILHNNGHQLCIGVSTASHDSNQTAYGDDLRLLGTRSQDLFNIMAIDTYSKHISILRVGANLTRLMHSKNHLCINYATRQVIWND